MAQHSEIDWEKPIQFKNGESCELIETNADGWKQWGARADGTYPTRCIKRHNARVPEAAHWYIHEDGKTNWPEAKGYYIINVPETI